jgi:hypothetical protein
VQVDENADLRKWQADENSKWSQQQVDEIESAKTPSLQHSKLIKRAKIMLVTQIKFDEMAR